MKGTNLDSWEGFLGSNFLKADDVSEDDFYVCTEVELDVENERPMLILENEGDSFKFSLNVTNSTFLKFHEIKSPKSLIGKKIKFEIVKAFSPSAKKEVDSLRIKEIK